MAHAHGTLHRERGLLTSAGKEIKSREEIISLWGAIWIPKRVVIVHCKGHQKGDSPGGRGNRLTDLVTWGMALEPVVPLHILVPCQRSSQIDLNLGHFQPSLLDHLEQRNALWGEARTSQTGYTVGGGCCQRTDPSLQGVWEANWL